MINTIGTIVWTMSALTSKYLSTSIFLPQNSSFYKSIRCMCVCVSGSRFGNQVRFHVLLVPWPFDTESCENSIYAHSSLQIAPRNALEETFSCTDFDCSCIQWPDFVKIKFKIESAYVTYVHCTQRIAHRSCILKTTSSPPPKFEAMLVVNQFLLKKSISHLLYSISATFVQEMYWNCA